MAVPVAVFTYKRQEHTKKTLEALNRNFLAPDTDLYIFSDAARGDKDREMVAQTRKYLEQFAGNNAFKSCTLHFADSNKGLACSIIGGVCKILEQYPEIIVVEDDLVTSKDFLNYMNDALQFYEKDSKIGAISGFTYPLKALKKYSKDVYLSKTGNSWGWATWREVWDKVDWSVQDYDEFRNNATKRKEFNACQHGITEMLDRQMNGEIDSWAVRWDYHFYENGLLTVYPKYSRVQNIGFDEMGTNCHGDNRQVRVEVMEYTYHLESLEISHELINESANYNHETRLSKLIGLLKNNGGRKKND